MIFKVNSFLTTKLQEFLFSFFYGIFTNEADLWEYLSALTVDEIA